MFFRHSMCFWDIQLGQNGIKLHNLIPYDIPQYDFRAISKSNTGNLTGWLICNDTTPTTEAIYHSMIQKRTVKCDRPTYLTGPRATTKVKPKVTCMWSRHKPGTSKMQVTYLNVCYIAHVQSWLCFWSCCIISHRHVSLIVTKWMAWTENVHTM